MKRKNRFIILPLILGIILSGMLIGASAADKADEAAYVSLNEGDANGTKYDTESDISAKTEEMSDSEASGTDDADTGLFGGFFEALYAAVVEHSAEITSAAAALTSIILAFCMKRGLTPMLKEALGGVVGAVGKLRDGVTESEAHAKEICDALTERLSLAEDTIQKLSEALSAVEASRTGEAEEAMMREDIMTVMSAQVELLYALFMSAALPEYKKDAVGEMVAEMRKHLGYREVNGDEA